MNTKMLIINYCLIWVPNVDCTNFAYTFVRVKVSKNASVYMGEE